MYNNNPIGIFDSGIGGLTVARAVNLALPNESLVYFGDTAHLPYGDKSPRSIRYYSEKISSFFIEQNCKAIIVACNSASSIAYDHLLNLFSDKTLLINVIDPVVEHVGQNKKIKTIGVIGTKTTIQSNVYQNKLNAINPEINIHSLPASLLVPMIEEGFVNCDLSSRIISQYLSDKRFDEIDALIMGCTHYPIIKNEIENFFKNKIHIFDSAAIVAEYTSYCLKQKGLLSKNDGNKNHKFYVSDYTPFFENITHIFFGQKVHLELFSMWD